MSRSRPGEVYLGLVGVEERLTQPKGLGLDWDKIRSYKSLQITVFRWMIN